MENISYKECKHLKIEFLRSMNWASALRGMRNAYESWDRSDSSVKYTENGEFPVIGSNDYELATKLDKAGTEHRKFLRQIFVSADVIAPWYWWKEQETYQIGTTENSTSQMHKMGSRLLKKSDFVIDDNDDKRFDEIIENLNKMIMDYQKDKTNKAVWRTLIQAVPACFIYRRTISLNYEVLANQYRQRREHKLIEWHEYLYQMRKLPYPELFTLSLEQKYQ